MKEVNYRRMVVSQIIRFADPDGNYELVRVDEGPTVTHVFFELRRHMKMINGPEDYSEIGEVIITVRCPEVRKQ